jgi:hypothetical protein
MVRSDSSTLSSEWPRPELLEAAFRKWIEGSAKGDMLVIGSRGTAPVSLERALRCLATSMRPLAPTPGAALGLNDDVTVGTAATVLLNARTDPDGPRCRSYRAASYFLIGQAHLASDEGSESSSSAPAAGGPSERSARP